MKNPSKYQLKNLNLSIEISKAKEIITCSLLASKVSVILDQIKENIEQCFLELDDENREILSQMKVLDEKDHPIYLYLRFPIYADQANQLIQDIKDKAEQEKYEEIQEEIEILLTEKSIPTEKQIELLEEMISYLKYKTHSTL